MRDYLDGPGLVEWIYERRPDMFFHHLSSERRAVDRWRNGAAASVYVADRVLTFAELHLSEIPDDLYLDYYPNGWNRT